uniref:Uncharacterized protein n=1 Tax=Anguilla anguilla TaxID=7936 RepID=A0A0E9U8J1_ANGAN
MVQREVGLMTSSSSIVSVSLKLSFPFARLSPAGTSHGLVAYTAHFIKRLMGFPSSGGVCE